MEAQRKKDCEGLRPDNPNQGKDLFKLSTGRIPMKVPLSTADYKATIGLITSTVEPKINEIINTLNKILKRKGVRVGADIKWYLDSTKEEKNVKAKKS